MKRERWVRTPGGTVGRVLEVQGRPPRHRLDVPGRGPTWVRGRVYDVVALTVSR